MPRSTTPTPHTTLATRERSQTSRCRLATYHEVEPRSSSEGASSYVVRAASAHEPAARSGRPADEKDPRPALPAESFSAGLDEVLSGPRSLKRATSRERWRARMRTNTRARMASVLGPELALTQGSPVGWSGSARLGRTHRHNPILVDLHDIPVRGGTPSQAPQEPAGRTNGELRIHP
jgi:hypothetical protein